MILHKRTSKNSNHMWLNYTTNRPWIWGYLYWEDASKCGILVKIIKIMIKIIKTFLLIGHNQQTKNQKNLYRQDVSKCGILAKVCIDPVRERKLLLHPHLSTTTMFIKMIFVENPSCYSILTLCWVPSAEASDIPPCVWMLSRFDTTWKVDNLNRRKQIDTLKDFLENQEDKSLHELIRGNVL